MSGKFSNATTWGPGKSGNPGGRPKGIERMTREEIDAFTHTDDTLGELTGWKAIRRRLFMIAMQGEDKDSIAAAKLLFDRGYGQARQEVKIEEGQVEPEVDWSTVPLERRKALIEAVNEIELYTASPDTEH